MRRVEIGEEEADRDGLDPFGLERLRRFADRGLVERLELLAARRHQPALHDLAMAALDQRPALPGQLLHDRVMLDALVAGDMDDVAEAFIGHHAGARAAMLEHGVGRGGGAVEDIVDLARRHGIGAAELGDAPEHGAREVVGRGRDLVDRNLPGRAVAIDEIRERAADIDADRPHALSIPSCFARRRPVGAHLPPRPVGAKPSISPT